MDANKDLNLLTLPDEMKLHVFKYLDRSGLMNARLVSKAFKRIVEQPEVLEKFAVTIVNSRQLQKILESQVPFNHFVLNFIRLEEQTYFEDFGRRYGPTMRVLNVKTRGGLVKLSRLLDKCQQLRTLEMTGLDPSFFITNSDNRQAFLLSVTNLRVLRIHEIEGIQPALSQIKFYLDVLHHCQSLEEVKIPKIADYNLQLALRRKAFEGAFHHQHIHPSDSSDNEEESWEDEIQAEPPQYPIPSWEIDAPQDILIHPVINLIAIKASKTPLKRLMLSGLKLLETTTFNDLISACHKYNVEIYGLESSQFYDASGKASEFINPAFRTVFRQVEFNPLNKVFPSSLLSSVEDLSVSITPVSHVNSPSTSESDFEDLSLLKHLTVQFISDVGADKCQNLIHKLFKETKRPSVKTLRLNWLLTTKSPTVGPVDLTRNYFNLCQLSIHGWDGDDTEMNLLWTGLQKLEKVRIFDCRKMTNKAFIGSFHKLTAVNSVIIRDVSGRVNEEAFLKCFKWMKLQRLEFYSTVIQSFREEVYRNLIKSPLGEHVEYLILPTASSHSRHFNERTLLNGFTNLKRRSCW